MLFSSRSRLAAGAERADTSSVFKRKSLTKSSVSRSPAHGGEILGSSVLQGGNVERKRSRDLVLKVIDFVNADGKNSGTVEGRSCYVGAAPLSPR